MDITARRGLFVGGLLVLICVVGLLSLATRLTPYVRNRAVKALNDRFDGEVTLESLRVSIFPRPAVSGTGLVLRHKGRTDVPPLIAIESFSASAGLFGLIGKPLRLHTVELHGLAIHVPPRRGHDATAAADQASATESPRAPVNLNTPPAAPAASSRSPGPSPIVIDRIVSRTARLEIAPKELGRPARVFDIADLVMTEFGFDRAATFQASLTNPKPEGQIETRGRFGPWHREEPGLTPLEADYVFKNANLGTIKGIGGILSSTGRLGGVLERIDVEGQTDTPDFAVQIAGQPVHLKTHFKAVVDGTNGNTWLDPVDATFLNSAVVAKGGVVRAETGEGRMVSLDVTIAEARIEDLLTFAIKAAMPPLTGQVKVRTKFLLPPGAQDVAEKLQLDGEFSLAEARFTNFDVQKRIDRLSRRGQGDTDDRDGESVVSNLRGRFVLKNGSLWFSNLAFGVPGVLVQLVGTYGLRGGAIDFTGDLLLDVPLSQTTTGFKAAVATIAQPFFRRRGGGSKVPIRITGTRSKLSFGLDVKKALTPGR